MTKSLTSQSQVNVSPTNQRSDVCFLIVENFEHCYQITLGINHENKKGEKIPPRTVLQKNGSNLGADKFSRLSEI